MALTGSVIVGTEDRARLAALLSDRDHRVKHVQRANIIVLSAELADRQDAIARDTVPTTRPPSPLS